MPPWSPSSWRSRHCDQEVVYPDPEAVQDALGQLQQWPPLVSSAEIERLRERLISAARGQQFLLQAGDCAEAFADCTSAKIAAQLKVILQVGLVLRHGTRLPVVHVARIAGQYAKPRSRPTETRESVVLPSFRGDLVNEQGFSRAERTPNPALLLEGYSRAALTLNFLRALIDGGFADARHPELWSLGHASRSPVAAEFQDLVTAMGAGTERGAEALAHPAEPTGPVLFTSHEAQHLPYEEAQTRRVPRRSGWYDLSTHMPWLGVRTAKLDGAHVEFLSGIQNPIGVKLGPDCSADTLSLLADRLDPERTPGRLTLVHRMGAGEIDRRLPPLVRAMASEGREVLWCCDPMHGNTTTSAGGLKTRSFEAIEREVLRAIELHEAHGSRLGGVHLELTADHVTECSGGRAGPDERELEHAYTTQVDPRLNYAQAIELALSISRAMSARHASTPEGSTGAGAAAGPSAPA